MKGGIAVRSLQPVSIEQLLSGEIADRRIVLMNGGKHHPGARCACCGGKDIAPPIIRVVVALTPIQGRDHDRFRGFVFHVVQDKSSRKKRIDDFLRVRNTATHAGMSDWNGNVRNEGGHPPIPGCPGKRGNLGAEEGEKGGGNSSHGREIRVCLAELRNGGKLTKFARQGKAIEIFDEGHHPLGRLTKSARKR